MSDNALLYIGAAAVTGFVLVALWKRNTAKPVQATASGALGTNPVTNPAAPKTPGDFARYDRTHTPDATSSTHFHDPVYTPDVPPVDTSYDDAEYVRFRSVPGN